MKKENSAFTLSPAPLWLCVLIAALVIASFSSAIHYNFIGYDTEAYLLKNPRVQGPFSWINFSWCFTTMKTGDWQPAVWLTFWIVYSLFGLNSAAFHAVNILLHTGTALLVFLCFYRATRRQWTSALLALFFAIHPLRAESVVWIAELKDVLSGFFGWLTLYAYLESHLRRSPKFLTAAFLFFICGILSKPILVTLPVLMLILDFWPLGRLPSFREFPKRLAEKKYFFLLSALSSFMAIWAITHIQNIPTLDMIPLMLRLQNSIISYAAYIGKTIFPFQLSIFYPFPHPEAKSAIRVGLVLAGLLAATYGAFRLRRKAPYFLAGWLWYLISLVPVIGIFGVSDQAMADRYSYWPSIGLGIIAAWMITEGLSVRYKKTAVILSLALLGYFLVTTLRQIRYWESSERLNRHALEIHPDNYVALSNLGAYYYKHRQWDQAFDYFKKSLQIRYTNDAFMNMSSILLVQKKYKRAEEFLSSVLPHLEHTAAIADIHFRLGLVYWYTQRKDLAESAFLEALKHKPHLVPCQNMLSEVYLARGDFARARPLVDSVLTKAPKNGRANWQKGFLMERTGDITAALGYYERASSALSPSPRALSRLTTLCIKQKDFPRIRRAISRFIQNDPQSAEPHLALARVLAAEGKPAEARACLQDLLKKHPDLSRAQKLLAKIR